MAKKKVVKPEDEDEDELDDFEDEFFDDEDDEVIGEYPKVSEKKEKEEISAPSEEEDLDSISEEEFELEEEARFPDYKHLKLKLTKTAGKDDYELIVEGQSHGFCNIFVKHLLTIEGVNAAAYKVTGIVPAQIFIRLENIEKYKIKKILLKAIESLREEVLEVQNVFKKLT
ncbi:MAG: RpoL/Rpb11 RNA polymerase subunit family protein [Candidatus Hermodarchaeota archaeon]